MILLSINLPLVITICALVLILIFASIICFKHHRRRKMLKDMLDYFNKSIQEKRIAVANLELVKNKPFDILFETRGNIYLVKMISNYSNNEICINSALKWQIRANAMDNSMRMLEGIEGLMTMKAKDIKKKIRKVFVVYPNAHSLLKYINECEMIFVEPETDVYGATVVTYNKLLENNSSVFDFR